MLIPIHRDRHYDEAIFKSQVLKPHGPPRIYLPLDVVAAHLKYFGVLGILLVDYGRHLDEPDEGKM